MPEKVTRANTPESKRIWDTVERVAAKAPDYMRKQVKTTMPDLTELLATWAELEPERCLEHADYSSVRVDSERWIPLHFYAHDVRWYSEAALMYAILAAIEARGWCYNMGTDQAGLHASVNRLYPDADWVIDPCDGQADSPAGALLSAYLEALQQEVHHA